MKHSVVIAVRSKQKRRRTCVRPLLRWRFEVGAHVLRMGKLRATDTVL